MTAPDYMTIPNKIAFVTGFHAISESQPHGANHAGLLALQIIDQIASYDRIDFFVERARFIAGKGARECGIATPVHTTHSIFEVTDLSYRNCEYQAILAIGPSLNVDNNPFSLRPLDDPAPVICDVDCTHSRQQWQSLFLGNLCGHLRPTDTLVFKSNASKQAFERVSAAWCERFHVSALPLTKIVSPNPVVAEVNSHDPNLRKQTRASLGILDHQVVYLTFSRIERFTKGDTFSLLKRWQELAVNSPQSILLITGQSNDNEYITDLRTLARELSISDRIIILPNPFELWNNARNRLMSAADVFLHLSTGVEESAPLVILEAMAHSLPIVAAKWAGIPENVENGISGYLIPLISVPATEAHCAMIEGLERYAANLEASRLSVVDPKVTREVVQILSSNEAHRRQLGIAARRFVIEHRSPIPIIKQRLAFIRETSVLARMKYKKSLRFNAFVPIDLVVSELGARQALGPDSPLTLAPEIRHDLIRHWIPVRLDGLAMSVLRVLEKSRGPLSTMEIIGQLYSRDELWESETTLHFRWVIIQLIAAGYLIA